MYCYIFSLKSKVITSCFFLSFLRGKFLSEIETEK
jgi:hypothetical protein